jgi:hypothetical protein
MSDFTLQQLEAKREEIRRTQERAARRSYKYLFNGRPADAKHAARNSRAALRQLEAIERHIQAAIFKGLNDAV